MADKRLKEDPINKVKSMARNLVDNIFDDLMEKNVLNGDELKKLGDGVDLIVNGTENLVENLAEKSQIASKIFMKRLFRQQLCLDISSDGAGGQNTPGLIISNKEFIHLSNRNGSEVDLSGMQDLLENLGYSVVVKVDLTAVEMEAVLWEFAARPEHRSSDSTILVFMSHGTLEGICGIKHQNSEPDILHDDTIFQIFNNRNCQSLRDKPKVIIMQACRGRGTGTTWVADTGGTSICRYDRTLQCYLWSDAVTKTHVEKDFIAFKSSTPHNISWRTDKHGSLFIYQLISHFKEYSWCYHLEEIFRKVQHSFENTEVLAQMPTIERVSMTRYFYLFPGI
ncbi:LOW QUALITY PROTEIN: inactive caspase-12 [Rhinolophus sinicus]|uniref:LOW QUALITY PROTEIN: inactive caspase-12 n=1 Tax=Rhinolophus sinicus TaxID=89399 RepID=UPI003D7993C6